MKTFKQHFNIGFARYLVDFHDGVKTHKDGSKFFDMKTFKGKRELCAFIDNLKINGYTEAT